MNFFAYSSLCTINKNDFLIFLCALCDFVVLFTTETFFCGGQKMNTEKSKIYRVSTIHDFNIHDINLIKITIFDEKQAPNGQGGETTI